MRRCESATTHAMAKYDIVSWVRSWRKIQFQWAAKVVQQGIKDPDRLTLKIADWKNIDTIRTFARANRGWQGHPGKLHIWRWESELYNFFAQQGLHWRDIAHDTGNYYEHLDTYLHWRDLPFADRGLRGQT